jgi:hypothetical protein
MPQTSTVHADYLSTLAQSHSDFLFGAFAELIQNAKDADAKVIDIKVITEPSTPSFTVLRVNLDSGDTVDSVTSGSAKTVSLCFLWRLSDRLLKSRNEGKAQDEGRAGESDWWRDGRLDEEDDDCELGCPFLPSSSAS